MVSMQDFNTKKVRLKQALQIVESGGSEEFQYQKGAIKTIS